MSVVEDLLVRCCAPTLAGIKTASLFTVEYGDRAELAEKLRELNCRLSGYGLKLLLLRFREKRALVYVYLPQLAFGCPAMGSEELEDGEFEPMFSACEGKLAGKRIALFGSYGWGDGEWMRSWHERCARAGASFAAEDVICCEVPDDAGKAGCTALGKALN